MPFGEAHKEAIDNLEVLAVETGIGYPNSFLPFRIFESYAWKHWAYADGTTYHRITTGSYVLTTLTSLSGLWDSPDPL